MTDQKRRRITIWTLIVVPLLPFLIGAAKQVWDTKESKVEHQADMQRIDTKLTRLLDVMCEIKQSRQCAEQ